MTQVEALGFPWVCMCSVLYPGYAATEDLAHFRKENVFQAASQVDASEETQSVDPIAIVH